jgi:hypothetical protein
MGHEPTFNRIYIVNKNWTYRLSSQHLIWVINATFNKGHRDNI